MFSALVLFILSVSCGIFLLTPQSPLAGVDLFGVLDASEDRLGKEAKRASPYSFLFFHFSPSCRALFARPLFSTDSMTSILGRYKCGNAIRGGRLPSRLGIAKGGIIYFFFGGPLPKNLAAHAAAP